MSEQDKVLSMLENGYLDEEIDSFGEKRYRVNQKFRDEQPELAKEFDTLVDHTVISLWQNGWIDIEIEPEGAFEVSLGDVTMRAVNGHEPELSKVAELTAIERAILSSIIEWVVSQSGRQS